MLKRLDSCAQTRSPVCGRNFCVRQKFWRRRSPLPWAQTGHLPCNGDDPVNPGGSKLTSHSCLWAFYQEVVRNRPLSEVMQPDSGSSGLYHHREFRPRSDSLQLQSYAPSICIPLWWENQTFAVLMLYTNLPGKDIGQQQFELLAHSWDEFQIQSNMQIQIPRLRYLAWCDDRLLLWTWHQQVHVYHSNFHSWRRRTFSMQSLSWI